MSVCPSININDGNFHKNKVQILVIDKIKNIIISTDGSEKGEIKFWDYQTGKYLASLNLCEGQIVSMIISEIDSLIIAISSYG